MTILPRSSVRPDSTNPPSKKSRLQQNPPISRRKSSPDLLDTSLPPDPSSLLPPPVSSPATPRHRILEPSYDTPSASAALDDRDSPDPLDTITPVTSTKTPTTSAITGSDAASKSSSDSARSSRSSLPNPPAVDSTEKKIPETSTAPAPTTVQPPKSVPDPPATGRRSLRSQDVGSRAKCELANYFHNYEELLSLVPPKSGEGMDAMNLDALALTLA